MTEIGDENESEIIEFRVTSKERNLPPRFIPSGPLFVIDGAGLQTFPAFAWNITTGSDKDVDQLYTFSLWNVEPEGAGALFTFFELDIDGTLRFEVPLGSEGTYQVTVKMEDDGGYDTGSYNRSFTAFNLSVYVPNTRIRGDVEYDSVLTVPEASQASNFAAFQEHYFTLADAPPAYAASQLITFTLTPTGPASDLAALFSEAPHVRPDGTLTFRLRPFASGTYTSTVRVARIDRPVCAAGDEMVSAGRGECRALPFTITVLPVNQPPEFTLPSFFSVVESSGPQVFTTCMCVYMYVPCFVFLQLMWRSLGHTSALYVSTYFVFFLLNYRDLSALHLRSCTYIHTNILHTGTAQFRPEHQHRAPG